MSDIDHLDISKTYLFNNQEVKLTTRYAIKQKDKGLSVIFYEVVPIENKGSDSFNQWVSSKDLLLIENMNSSR